MNISKDIVITTNSPGEVSGWVAPAIAALKERDPSCRIIVFLTFDVFASGAERRVVEAIPGADLVAGPFSLLRFALFGIRPRGYRPSPHGLVLFLGGDLAYASRLAKRLHYPTVIYNEGRAGRHERFSLFAVPYESMAGRLRASGVAGGKIRIVGNLMLDAVRPAAPRKEFGGGHGSGRLLLLLPGSRPRHFQFMVPFLLQTARQIRKSLPDLRVELAVSPFISDQQLKQVIMDNRAEITEAENPAQSPASAANLRPLLIQTEDGLTVSAYRGRQYDQMASADLALTLPGTNTAELAFMGTPTVVVLPLSHPERIPLEGLAGLIGGIPVIGRIIKRRLIPGIIAKQQFTAWPNRLAGEFVIPEVRGDITPADVSRAALDLLGQPQRLREISARLRQVVGEPGAAVRLAELVQEVFAEHYGHVV